MSRARCFILPLLCVLAACGRDPGPALAVAGLEVYAPVPGSSAGVAYMTLTNRSGGDVVVEAARSPQFDRAEFHETRLEDGVMKMRAVDRVLVPAGDSVKLAPGGLHLMLIGASPGAVAGAPVMLELTHGDGLLVVSADLSARVPAE